MLRKILPFAFAIVISIVPNFVYANDTDDDEEEYVDPRSVRFRIAFEEELNTRMNIAGDPVKARLMEDLKYDDALIAPKGSLIKGRIEQVPKKHLSKHRTMTVRFDQISTPDKKKIPIFATACPQHTIFSNGQIVREIKVGPDGEFQHTGTSELYVLEDLKIEIPKKYLNLKDRLEIDIRPGDQIQVSADISTLTNVSGKILKP